jgi:hypothetical protein
VLTIVVVGCLAALAAAARGTWSPCGLSMLSTITPFGERARGHRYGATAAWFIAGAVAGGLSLGAVGALAALGLHALAGSGSGTVLLAVGSGLALGAALVDAGAFGDLLPLLRRQVDDGWVARYRPWVYAGGFGWQIGTGVATYLMTASVLLVAALAVLSASVPAALAVCGLFGLARGSTVLLAGRAPDPARLRSLHAALERLGPVVRHAVIGLQSGAAAGLAWAAAGSGSRPATVLVAAALTAAGALAGMLTWRLRHAAGAAGEMASAQLQVPRA